MPVFDQRVLDVGEGHRVFVEQSGSIDGMPVIVLHGGPGAGASPLDRQIFAPDRFRTIVFDQRGGARSRPLGRLHANRTDLLVADIERIRTELAIEQWFVFGRSWGSYLALRYGSACPERCLGFLLYGAFLPSAQSVHSLYESCRATDSVTADAWQAYREASGARDGQSLLAAFAERIQASDPSAALAAATAFSAYQTALSVDGNQLIAAHPVQHPEEEVIAFARVQIHYAINRYFAEGDCLDDLVAPVADRPCRLIHGSADRVCPIENAHLIARKWRDAAVRTVNGAPHAAFAPANFQVIQNEALAFVDTGAF